MHNSIQIKIAVDTADIADLLVAQLNELGYEGFEEQAAALLAYCPEPSFDEEALRELLAPHLLVFEKSVIAAQNWNTVWESNFDPVIVDDFVAVRAEFHEPIPGVAYEIVITPKMSFGTGHHATTRMMMQQMRGLEFKGKTVFDFGTGTGILAILADKLGAAKVIAIDCDEWCITNAAENIVRNNCAGIALSQGDIPPVGEEKFDVILANINKHILLQFLPALANMLNKGAHMLLSGLLEEDEADILLKSSQSSLLYITTVKLNKWICVLLCVK